MSLMQTEQFTIEDTLHYGEVQFFFQASVQNQIRTLTLVSTYSPPDPALLHDSYNTIWTTQYRGADGLEVIDVSSILSVVCIAPLPAREAHYFVAEKIGLEVAMLAGLEEELDM
jgi:hypothetical protein